MSLLGTTIVELTRIRRGQIVTYTATCLNGYFIGESGPLELEHVLRQRIYKRCGWSLNGRQRHSRRGKRGV